MTSEEQELTARYCAAKRELMKVGAECELFFVRLAVTALNAGDFVEANSVMRRCPDILAETLIRDIIMERQSRHIVREKNGYQTK